MQAVRRKFLHQCAVVLTAGLVAPATLYALSDVAIEYPEHSVREFLKLHFAGSRAFTARGLDRKERWFTRRFRKGLYKYFDKVAKSPSSPPMVMDPFTGSQGATAYSVGDAKVRSEKAWVPVRITEGGNRWTVTYLMRNDQERNDDTWRIDDIQDIQGMLLTTALKK